MRKDNKNISLELGNRFPLRKVFAQLLTILILLQTIVPPSFAASGVPNSFLLAKQLFASSSSDNGNNSSSVSNHPPTPDVFNDKNLINQNKIDSKQRVSSNTKLSIKKNIKTNTKQNSKLNIDPNTSENNQSNNQLNLQPSQQQGTVFNNFVNPNITNQANGISSYVSKNNRTNNINNINSISNISRVNGNLVTTNRNNINSNPNISNKKLALLPTALQEAGEVAVVRHGPALNGGRAEGSIRVLLGEQTNINSNTVVTGDLLVPGSPNININGNIKYNGTITGTGSANPTNYGINLNNGTNLRHIVTHTNPISMPVVTPPPNPTGNRNVTLSNGQSPGDFATILNLTLHPNYGALLAVPPGTYGQFIANNNTGFIFGIEGENTTYNLQDLILNSSTQLQILGNVTINIKNQINLNSQTTVGNQLSPVSLSINISNGGMNLNSQSKLYGVLTAPNGTVNINANSLLKGLVICDRLHLNANGLLQGLFSDTISPVVTITQPLDGATLTTQQVTVTGTFDDDSVVTLVKVNGVTASITNQTFTASIPLTLGSNTITAVVTDIFGNNGQSSITVTFNDGTNQAPQVNAGQDQTITLPSTASLSATATDDGLPSPPGQLTYLWSKVSGPGTVSFSTSTSLNTTASFSVAGIYNLRITANDSLLSASDDIVITVNSEAQQNQAPQVNAGNDQSINLPNVANLSATATDDGLPNPPAQLTFTWSKVSGPGTVNFSNPNSLTTTASFSEVGTYVLRLSVTDSELSASDEVQITVNAQPVENQAPQVNAGSDQSINLPNVANLVGTVTDDGLPSPPAQLTFTWSKVSGPGTVNLSNPNSLTTTASFSEAGTYVIRLTADDSELIASDEVQITVNAQPVENQAPQVNAGIDQTITLPSSVTLNGVVTDDGLPSPPSELTISWSKVSGPGTVTFSSQNTAITQASFSLAGTYLLRLSASDSQLIGSDEVTITVNEQPAQNQAPIVNAGVDQEVTLPSTANLVGTVTDDGLPSPPAQTTVTWSKVSGPGTVSFSSPNSLTTTASFSESGTYIIRLSATDSELSASDELTVLVNPQPAQNQAPIVNAGTNQSINLSENLIKNASNESELVNGEIANWTEVIGSGWTQAIAGSNGLPSALQGNTYFVAGDSANAELSQDIDVSAFASQIANATQLFEFRGYVRSKDETPSDSARIVVEYRNATDLLASFDSGLVSSVNNWQLVRDLRNAPIGTTIIRIRLIATLNSGTSNDAYFDYLSLRTANLASTHLTATASDDGLPVGSSLTTNWTKVSGPGNVVFSDENSVSSNVSFDQVGEYVLRLTASDSVLTSSSDVTITVINNNVGAIVNAGDDKTITLPNTASLSGSYLEDGLPVGANITTTWSKIDGTGNVSFTDANSLATTATFTEAGIYTLRLTVNDSVFTTTDDVIITVEPEPIQNTPPQVNAGNDQSINLPNVANLVGIVTDDGLPSPPAQVTVTWTKVSGPGIVTFSAPNNLTTAANFSEVGTYVLRLSATDSELTASDDIEITVSLGENQAPIVNAGEDQTLVAGYGPNLIRNPGNEGQILSGRPEFWPSIFNGAASWIKPVAGTSPYPESVEGTSFFTSTTVSGVQQDIDVSLYEQSIAAGTQKFTFNAYVRAGVNNSNAFVSIQYLSSTGAVLTSYNTGAINSNNWTLFTDIRTAPVGTKTIRIQLNSSGGYIDALSLRALLNSQTLAITNLVATVTDDGLPSPPSQVTVTWSKVSGPGTVTFANSNQINTAVSFSDLGTYVLRLTATDSLLSSFDEISIVVSNVNNINDVVVSAGDDQTLVVAYGPNLIKNPGNEAGVVNGRPVGWKDGTNWVQVVAGIPPYPNAVEGNSFFFSPNGSTEQNIDVSLYAQSIDSGNQKFIFTGYIRKSEINNGTDISVTYLSATGTTLANYSTGIVAPTDWTVFTDLRTAPVGTKTIRVKITSFGAYVDGLSLRALLSTQSLATTSLTGSVLENTNLVDDRFNLQWSKVSGPGAVSFSTPNKITTNATFTDLGTYVLRLRASDLGFSLTDDVSIVVKNIANTSNVIVNAGEDKTLSIPYGPNLIKNGGNEGQLINNIPQDWTGSGTWTQPASPPNPTPIEGNTYFFATSNTIVQNIDLSAYEQTISAGTQNFIFSSFIRRNTDTGNARILVEYLSVQGVVLGSYDTGFANTKDWTAFTHIQNAFFGTKSVRITLNCNNAYVDSLSLRALLGTTTFSSTQLTGLVLEGTNPVDDRLYLEWSKVSGPGNVIFSNPTHLSTNVTFTDAGTYILRLTASDLDFSLSDDISVTLNLGQTQNIAPRVVAGLEYQSITLPTNTVTLKGAVTDDGLPTPINITTTWSKVSGPGTIIFSNPNSLTTTATFSIAGVYLIRLSVSDSQLITTNDITVEVFPLVSTTLSDLVVKQVDTSLVTVNSQTLEVLGTVSANIANNAASTSATFSVTFFEDLNSNQILDVTDNILGTATQNGLQSGDSVIVSASVSGTVQFQNTLIYAFVDSNQEVSEFNETNNYNNSQPACEFTPLESPFNGTIKYAWTSSSVLPAYKSVSMTPVVADLNGDSIPDIIFSASQGFGGDAVIRAISGNNGSELFTVTNLDYAVKGLHCLAVGDIDGDGLPEIVGVHKNGRLIAFENDGSFKWLNTTSILFFETSALTIADLDNDGFGEIISGRQVFNNDGSLRWSGTGSQSVISMVVDLDLDGTPEIVSSHTVYRANGQIMWQRPELLGDFTAIGNFDADVFPEIVVVSRALETVFLLEHDGTTKWSCVMPADIDVGGPPTIGDFDGDGEVEIGIAGMRYYVVIETNGVIKWTSYAPNVTAGVTPSGSFDFDGDGSAEIVYADEQNLRIYKGTDGTVLWQTPTNSQTALDMAVIADVDADGSADIVLGSNPSALGPLNGIRVYHNQTGKWVGTRKIWNQLDYHVSNINDDATIPRQEERSWTKYNVYRSQQQVNGCIYARADLTASYVRTRAENTNVLVTARIGNGAGLKAKAAIAISFYDGNPSAGGTKLQTVNTLTEILPGKYEDVVATFTNTTIANPLWIVVDDGNNVLESNETNNIYNSGIILGIGNQAPTVNAGDDQTITLPSTASLSATVTDDGFPSPPGQVLVAWSKVDGPGTVSFTNPNSLTTTASFSQLGVYTLRLTANDSQLQSSDDVVVTVNPAAENQAPQVNAGANQSISLQANLVQNGGNEAELVNGEIPSWQEVSGNWTQAVAGSNGLPNTYEGNTYFISSDSANAELTQTIDVTNFSTTITAQTQEFAFRALVRNANESPNDSARIVIEYLDSSNTILATLDTENIPNTNDWTEVTDQRLAPIGTTNVRIRLVAMRNSGTTTDVYFDAVSFRPVGTTATLLSSTATDDGLPVGSSLTINWTKVSGPGNVVFSTPNQAITSVIFDEVGTYVLRLSASDSVLSADSDITITVNSNNVAPSVNAGDDQTITLPSTASLSGSVSDDGLPLGANVTTTWSKVSGSGTVTFSNPNELNTTASFSEAGTYVLALSANDTELNTSDEITIVVNQAPVQNQAPQVNAGIDQTITLPNTANLSATATDDGLPSPPAQLTFTWTKLTGPGTVNFGTPNSLITTASFSEAGSYVLRITANDSALSASDDVIVNVNAEGQQNQAPTVNAGADQTLAITEIATLTGTATDDGLPPGSSLFYLWEKVSGPGTVGFNAPNSLQTQAQFSAEGVYVLRLSVSDSQFTTTDEVQITVVTPNVPAPEVTIHSPTDGSTITNLTDVVATITYTGTGINWVLDYSLNPNDDLDLTRTYTTIATGNTTVTNSTIATFDPTVMLNGNYLLRLTATDNFGRSVNTVATVIVDKNLKVGNFTLSFTDLAVPVAGIPITVIRTYDSRDKRKGDFGVGWTLDVKNIRLEKSSSLGKHWIETLDQEGFTFRYRLVQTRSKFVTITFPDGKVFKFKAVPNPNSQIAAIVNLNGMDFVPEPGTFGTLVALEEQELRVEGDVPQVPPGAGVVQIINLQGSTPGQPFNPRLFKLTTLEGAEFIIDEFNGLQSITDLNGNSLTVNNNGLVHSSGKSITFTRDGQGRITQVTDPSGNVQTYTYDTAGDLVSHRDMENNVTSFGYDNNHYLLDITDPRGIKPIRNEYDDDGRLLKHTDAFNKEIIYTHQIAARTEVIADRLGNTTTFEYDNSGNVLKQTNALGHITTYTYDSNDNQLTETNALGKTTTSTYDQFDNVLTQTDALNNTVTYTYNTRRQVLTITDPKGNVTTNTYDNKGNLTTTKDALNNTTSYTYNPFGLVLTQTDALGHVTTYQYSGSQPSQITDAQGNISSFTYDTNGNQLTQTVTRTVNGSPQTITSTNTYDKLNRLTKVTYPDGSETTTTYNAIGKVASSTDQLGRSTSYNYDSMGQLLSTTFADGTTSSATFDAEGRRLTSTDQLGRVTSFQYDVLGRLTKTTAPDNSFTTTVYDSIGRVTSTTDQLGHSTSYEYDANCGCSGRRSKIIDALGNQTSFAYDQNGNQISFTDARGNTTSYTYDQLNRQTRTTFPDGTYQEVTYDQLGRRVAVRDQAGSTNQFFYDSLGRLIKVKDALNHETQYSYDELGQQITQTDAKGRTTSYEYDKLGRRIKRTLPMGQFETYDYDLGGRLTSHRDFDSKVTSFAYDQLNRLLSETPDASFNQAAITFTYNNLGQIVTATGVDGTISLNYDNRNRLTQAVTPQGTLSYSYNLLGNILSVTSSNAQGVTLEFGYDLLNRLQQVKDNNQPTGEQLTSYSYDQVGNLSNVNLPNGVSTNYQYNNLNRLTNVTTTKASTTISSYAYTLGPAGNRLSVAELSGRMVNYSYDSIYRLTNETITGASSPTLNGSVDYVYDEVGNRVSRTSTLAAIPSQQAIAVDDNDRLLSDTYDDNGSTTSADGYSYGYDYKHRIISVIGNGKTISIKYNAFGNRVEKSVTQNGQTVVTKYLVDTNNHTGYAQVVEEIQDGVVSRQYSYGLDLISQRQLIGSDRITHYYGVDGHGSVRYLTDIFGAITDTYDYSAYGNLINQTGNTSNNYLYAGEQFDYDLNLYYNRARYLDVNRGRFWSQDSFEGVGQEPASLHKYLYAANDPVNNVDPSGNFYNPNIPTINSPKHQLRRSRPLNEVLDSSISDLARNAQGAKVGFTVAYLVVASLVAIGISFVDRNESTCEDYNKGFVPILRDERIKHIIDAHGNINPLYAGQFDPPYWNKEAIKIFYELALLEVLFGIRKWKLGQNQEDRKAACVLEVRFYKEIGTTNYFYGAERRFKRTPFYAIVATQGRGFVLTMYPVDLVGYKDERSNH